MICADGVDRKLVLRFRSRSAMKMISCSCRWLERPVSCLVIDSKLVINLSAFAFESAQTTPVPQNRYIDELFRPFFTPSKL